MRRTDNEGVPRSLRRLSLFCALCALSSIGAGTASASPALTPVQRGVADQLVSVFENSTTIIRYGYIQNLHDGCGYTAGRAGFCTATGDMLLVVERYARQQPGAALVTYLPTLRARAAAKSDSVTGLGARFTAAWRTAAADAAFRADQDDVVDEEYYAPAFRRAVEARLKTPLAVAIFYDTAIEHGTAHDYDGLPALISRTRARAGGLPGAHVGERRWLATVLRVRRADLLHPHNVARRADWPESVGRVDALARLLRAGHTGLRPPLRVNPWGDYTFTLRG
jgi:chitosanase